MELEIKKPDRIQAAEASRSLKKEGVNMTVERIMSSRCLVAVNDDDEVISFARYIRQDEADVFHFRTIGRKEKNRIKVRFFSIIFSQETWKEEEEAVQDSVRQGNEYMFPG